LYCFGSAGPHSFRDEGTATAHGALISVSMR
jgi:hypothetical protein